MSEMVERVARAIWDQVFDKCDEPGQCRGDEWEAYTDHARAAIAAMREPTEAMLDASGADEHDELAFRRRDGEHVWEAMIDAALAPKT